MDKRLSIAVDRNRPRINPSIGNGIVKERSADLLSLLEANFMSSAKSFPEGFKFLGLEKCSAPEAYAALYTRKANDRTVDLSKNSVTTVAYKFELHGKPLDLRRYLQVPFVSRGNMMFIKNSKYIISPVIANETFSISGRNVFLPVSKTKFTFEAMAHAVSRDGETVHISVVTSAVHHHKPASSSIRDDTRVRSDTSLISYLFAKLGVVATIKQYTGIDAVLGNAMTVNTDSYPPDQWAIYSSMQLKPSTVMYDSSNTMPCDNKVAIPRKSVSSTIDTLLGNYFFACDEYPTQTRFEDIHESLEIEKSWWKWVLNQHIYRDNHVLSKVELRMDEHIKTLDTYLDVITQRGLANEGLVVENIYDVFMYVIDNFTDLLQSRQLSCLYGKKLKVKYYMASPMVKQFNNFTFKLGEAKNSKNGVLPLDRVKQCIYKGLSPDVFKEITKQDNVVTPAITTAGDCFLHKQTTSMVMQDDATQANMGKRKKVIGDGSKYLDASMLQCCSISIQSTGNPTGHTLNPYQKLGNNAELLLDPDKADILNTLSDQIRRM